MLGILLFVSDQARSGSLGRVICVCSIFFIQVIDNHESFRYINPTTANNGVAYDP